MPSNSPPQTPRSPTSTSFSSRHRKGNEALSYETQYQTPSVKICTQNQQQPTNLTLGKPKDSNQFPNQSSPSKSPMRSKQQNNNSRPDQTGQQLLNSRPDQTGQQLLNSRPEQTGQQLLNSRPGEAGQQMMPNDLPQTEPEEQLASVTKENPIKPCLRRHNQVNKVEIFTWNLMEKNLNKKFITLWKRGDRK